MCSDSLCEPCGGAVSAEVSHAAHNYVKVQFVLVHTLKAYGGMHI
jgi:hypothetical protein